MAKIIITVTSDLVTDQRVHKISQSLHDAGYEVLLYGRKKWSSQPLGNRAYKTKRVFLLFEKGFLFYIAYNVRLFWFLLFTRADMMWANDLDTLLPNFLISKIFKRKLIYDAHEYFTGVPELLERPFVRSVWKKIETLILPKLNTIVTVNESVAQLYSEEYSIKVHVIKNYPKTIDPIIFDKEPFELIPAQYSETAVVLNLIYELLKTEKRKIIIYQGAINKDRGIEEMISAMEFLENVALLIIGTGDLYKTLKSRIKGLWYHNRIFMIGPVSMEYLPAFTQLASLGLSLEKPTNINYQLASPNKVVDYIQANIPVLASPLVEITKLFTKYDVGTFIESHQPELLAKKINEVLDTKESLYKWKSNTFLAKTELNWSIEEKKLLQLVSEC